ncbi:MAG: serine/threonine protein kinase, partial [Myxococcaceae bacterium]|nr:serine/threonine protein kinase [Myxococcaceae bacterium]
AESGTTGATDALNPTRLGTHTRAELLEERWLLKEPIGMAPSATLWLARDTSLDRPVTVKLLNGEHVGDADAVARFENEARIFARIDHKNLALALSTGRHQGLPFLVMKQLKGRSLAELLHARGGRLELAQAAAVGAELCDAAEALEANGAALGNLQPRQVHVGENGEVVLIDLGDSVPGVLAEAGYRAPEVLSGQPPGPRSALYSLGALLYELLSGRPPFEGDPGEPIVEGAAISRPPGLVAGELGRAVMSALSPNPVDRPASVLELKSLLMQQVPQQAVSWGDSPWGPAGTNTEAVTARLVAHIEAVKAPVAAAVKPTNDPELAGPTRALPALQVQLERERVTAPRPFHKQPSGRRALLVSGLVAALLLVTLVAVSLSAGPDAPPLAEPIPRSELPPPGPPPQPVDRTAERAPAPLPVELEQRKKELSTVNPGQETLAKSHPKLRSGPTVTPSRVNRQGRRLAVDPGAQAAVVLTATFKGRPVRAQVEVDGIWRGATPLDLRLAPGDHTFKLDATGSALTEITLGFRRGEAAKVDIELRPREQAAQRPNAPMAGATPE